MRKNYYVANAYSLGITANGRVDKRELGAPLGTFMLSKNRRGIDFAAIERALRKNQLIFSLNTHDGKVSIEFGQLLDYPWTNQGPTKKTARPRHEIK